MLVRAPGSSANLGPGFDCLGLAVDLPFWLASGRPDGSTPVVPDGSGIRMLPAEGTHPAVIAHQEAGGQPGIELWWRSAIPPGRGLGFSGAARVAGAFAARRSCGDAAEVARQRAFDVAEQLEGHGDNAAASAFGGFAVVAGDKVAPVVVPDALAVLVWSPSAATSTDASRAELPAQVDLADAAFSVARASLWVAALGSGRLDLLADASRDRLHQPTRLAARSDSAAVLEVLGDLEGVHAAWLSGSGPSVAALVDPAVLVAPERLRWPHGADGRCLVVSIDRGGVSEVVDAAV